MNELAYVRNAFQGLVHEVTDGCGNACPCTPKKKSKKKKKIDEEICCLQCIDFELLEVLSISLYHHINKL